MPLLLLLSVSTAAYGWSFDLVVLIPAVLQATIITLQKGRLKSAGIAVLSFVMTNVIAYWLNFHDYGELYYVWMAPALLVGYLVICRVVRDSGGPMAATFTSARTSR